MNTTKINKTLKGIGLAFAMVLGVLIFSGTNANAQDRRSNWNNNDRYYNYDRGRIEGRFELNRYDNSWARQRELERIRLERLRWEREHRRRPGFSLRIF